MMTIGEVYSLEQTKKLVDTFLSDYLEQHLDRANKIDPSYGRLIDVLTKYTLDGGKRVRPYLLMIANLGYGGSADKDVVATACAWEMLHGALLVHDDIIDRDDIRHGKPNIAGRYQSIYGELGHKDSDHYATSSALLAGDLLISFSQQIVLDSDLEDGDKLEILRVLNKAIFEVGGGELIDTETALYEIGKTDARRIARYKTAGYTFQLPLISGAYLAGASQDEIELLRQLGDKLGIAFQLIDDVLGVFGASVATGKSVDSDIRERKQTVLVQEAFGRLTGDDKQELHGLYDVDKELSDEDIERVRTLLVDSGAKEAVLAEAQKLTHEAEKLITKLQMNDQAKQTVKDPFSATPCLFSGRA